MAKRDGKVRKGFFFYLLLFLLIIVAFVLVCVCIMLFNPEKNVLGFESYSNNDKIEMTNTTDDSETEINLGVTKYSEIVINSNGADVEISNNTNFSKNSIVFVNRTKGFIKTEDYKQSSYSVTIEGTKLIIEMDYTEGFIKRSSDAKIYIHIADLENTTAFKDTIFTIDTTKENVKTSGDILIGGTTQTGYTADLPIKGISAITDKGNVSFSSHSATEFSSVYMRTSSGIIDFTGLEEVSSKDGKIAANIGNGKLKAKKINCNLEVTTETGTVNIDEIKGNVSVMGSSAIVNITKVAGNLDLGASTEVISDCKLNIKEVTGIVSIPKGEDTDVNIDKVGGAVLIFTTSGNVNIGNSENLIQHNVKVQTKSGNISLYLGNEDTNTFVTTESGNIYLNFANGIVGTKEIKTEKGKTTIDFSKNSKVKFNFISYSTDIFDLSNIDMEILNGKTLTTNPYLYNCNESTKQGVVSVSTDNKLVLNLI